jgi:hypothetical protein
LKSAWNIAAAGAAAEIAFGVKAFLVSGLALPADNFHFVGRTKESVVVVHFAVAFGASHSVFLSDFGVCRFGHFILTMRK